MKYVNAKAILPDALVKELQGYIQGGYLYVPAKAGRQKRWGEVSGSRKELAARDAEITAAYRAGVSVEALAEKYFCRCTASGRFYIGSDGKDWTQIQAERRPF